MSAISKGDISGLARKMRAIPPKYQEAVDRALDRSADEMVRTARALAPVDSGDLWQSIKAEPFHAETGYGYIVTAGSKEAFYARWVEFGSKAGSLVGGATRRAARAFFFPAYRLMRKRLKQRIRTAARRAAKAAAHG